MTDVNPPAVEMLHITKRFSGGVVAVEDVSIGVAQGEIHAVIGENGAGKSTLMGVLSGLIPADSGEIRLSGAPVSNPGPASAVRHGIGMVYQHFMLIPVFTVAENIVLGREPAAGLRFDRRAAEEQVRALSDRYGLKVDPAARVETLSVGQEQRVEILKVLHCGADILILDEPTAVLTPQETKDLFSVLLQLKSQGKTILFISHKLNEVLAIADTITVLRHGKVVETMPAKGAMKESLARMMVGRDLESGAPDPRHPVGAVASASAEVLLELERIEVLRDNGLPALRGVSLQVRSGEILGLAGVEGNGQTELLEVAAGLREKVGGEIRLHDGVSGRDVSRTSISERHRLGLSHIPEDRHRRGLVLDFSVVENAILGRHRDEAFCGPWGIRSSADIEAATLAERFEVHANDLADRVRGLSGGNQQKLVVGRELARRPRVLLAAQPTRGVDLAAVAIIHRALREARSTGAAILLVSSDLSELLALSDRIAVMYEGSVVATLDPAKTTEEELGLYMAGGGRSSAIPS
ncbi:MAG: ABC transporter ATP-binding protein [Planctomycetes bacterium]|nr:ABC transporter ATP-binding protein [Planctomycetota bacterium]